MKRGVVAALVVVAALAACASAPEPMPTDGAAHARATIRAAVALKRAARAATPLEKPLFWSVERDGKTTYFLGTMHAGIDAERRLPAIVWTKLRDAPVLAMEADVDDPEIMVLLQPTGHSLRDALGESYWKKLEYAIGLAAARAIEHMPPVVPVAQLALRALPPTPAMDKVLSGRAVNDNKRVVYLETAASQMAMLKKWMDLRALKMLLDELPNSDRRSKLMLEAYIEGDERKMAALGDGELAVALRYGYTEAEYHEEMNDVLYDRNAAWIDPLEKLHADGGGFVAVGAMHLVGPRSVLAMLSDRGYQVTRVAP